ncbi:MAG TPA: tail fiber protein [Silvibacterium sp.]|jgi:microcystin-dependent protein|nr:tail fiber protein [Silvibacterium sp.]
MGSPYVGEIRMFAGNYAPYNWLFCEGQVLSIAENTTLFQLIGTTYGGDGINTFALPDLRGRLPIHLGSGFAQGQNGGAETVTLTTTQTAHPHPVTATANSSTVSLPGGNFLASGPDIYDQNKPGTNTMAPAISPVGGNQPHNNFQPYLCVDFIISLFGIYPSQS